MSLLLALTLAAQTTAADTPGLVIPEPVRYEFVFTAAQATCPILEMLAKKGATTDDIYERLKAVIDRLGLSPAESILLVDFCKMRSDR